MKIRPAIFIITYPQKRDTFNLGRRGSLRASGQSLLQRLVTGQNAQDKWLRGNICPNPPTPRVCAETWQKSEDGGESREVLSSGQAGRCAHGPTAAVVFCTGSNRYPSRACKGRRGSRGPTPPSQETIQLASGKGRKGLISPLFRAYVLVGSVSLFPP